MYEFYRILTTHNIVPSGVPVISYPMVYPDEFCIKKRVSSATTLTMRRERGNSMLTVEGSDKLPRMQYPLPATGAKFEGLLLYLGFCDPEWCGGE